MKPTKILTAQRSNNRVSNFTRDWKSRLSREVILSGSKSISATVIKF